MAARTCVSIFINSASRGGSSSTAKKGGRVLPWAAHPGFAAFPGAIGYHSSEPLLPHCPESALGNADEGHLAKSSSTLRSACLLHPRGSPILDTSGTLAAILSTGLRWRFLPGWRLPLFRSTLHTIHTAGCHFLLAEVHPVQKSLPRVSPQSPPVSSGSAHSSLPTRPETADTTSPRCARSPRSCACSTPAVSLPTAYALVHSAIQ